LKTKNRGRLPPIGEREKYYSSNSYSKSTSGRTPLDP